MNYVILLCAYLAYSTFGVDYSTLFATSQISCLVGGGRTFAIPRGYCSYGGLDSNIKQNLKNAWNGGMTNVDLYMFPCVPCNNPKEQVRALVEGVKGEKYGMIWIDIEILNWNADHNVNRNFILQLIEELKAENVNIGIYTNNHNWVNIVGSDWSALNEFPLWYAHYDDNPSFSDFTSFGGWTKPSIKQYKGTTSMCSGGVDLNFY